MADKKLSDVTSVEDFDYFLGVKSNGDVQKMSKDSMKKVISELMSSFLQISSPKNFIVSNPSDMETGIISIGDASREISKSEKLNEPSEDIPFIRGIDSNGNPIYIGKEQFSSVLAELIGIATPQKNGLLSKDGFFPVQDTSPDDANDVNNGIYRINSKSTNYPYENTNGLIVGFTTQNGYLRGQICFTIWPETVYFRTKGDSWGAWKQIS